MVILGESEKSISAVSRSISQHEVTPFPGNATVPLLNYLYQAFVRQQKLEGRQGVVRPVIPEGTR